DADSVQPLLIVPGNRCQSGQLKPSQRLAQDFMRNNIQPIMFMQARSCFGKKTVGCNPDIAPHRATKLVLEAMFDFRSDRLESTSVPCRCRLMKIDNTFINTLHLYMR